MPLIRDTHTLLSNSIGLLFGVVFWAKSQKQLVLKYRAFMNGLLVECETKGKIKDDLTKCKKTDNDIHNSLICLINAMNTL